LKVEEHQPHLPPPSTVHPTPSPLPYLRPIFHEEQRFTGTRLFIVIAAVFASVMLLAAGTVIAVGASPKPVIFIISLSAMIVLTVLGVAKLTTIVDAGGVHVRFVPFLRKTFALDDIVKWEPKTYDPMEYGGWGVRGLPDRYGWAYNVSGRRGVQIEFKNGHRLMLGSQRADELAKAIGEAKAPL
jgi:hypothetical protein